MSENNTSLDNVDLSVTAINNPTDLKDKSIPQILKWIMFEGTESLRRQKLNELKKLATSQQEIGFLNNLRRVFMLGANEDGTFTVNEELKNLLNKVSNPGSEGLMQLLNELGLTFNATYSADSFQNLFAEIEALEDSEQSRSLLDQLESLGIQKGQQPTQKQLDDLVKCVSLPENIELRKHLTNNKILTTKDKFTRPERENFIESIRLAVEQKSTINEMASQTIMRLQSEIDKFQMYTVELLKSHKKMGDVILGNMRKG